MPYQNISSVLSNEDKEYILTRLNEITAKLPFLVNLTTEERRSLSKMGDKSVAFVTKAMDYASTNPEFVYNGNDPEVKKAYEIVCRLRNYAKTVIIFEENIIPYYLAVLEWTLPYVSYQLDNDLVRYYAVMSSALICENILRIEEKK